VAQPEISIGDGAVRSAGRRRLGVELTDIQADAARSVVEGRDTLLISPTGSGKSAVYQLSGSLLHGTTIVVSPLLALQEDQLAGLRPLDIGSGAVLSSLHGRRHRTATLDALARGDVEFLLLAPEQLVQADVQKALTAASIDRFVVDEAHCIDAWGADFRPDFQRLGTLRRQLGCPPALALTATAAPHVEEEIIASLVLDDPLVLIGDLRRPNISLRIEGHATWDAAVEATVDGADGREGSGLVYVSRRQVAEDLARRLDRPERPAVAYHGSLPRRRRDWAHARFRSAEPVVVVATSAFGLGVDAPHVRFVLHLEAPETIDAYCQEIGRAGRDGAPAEAVLHHVTGTRSGRRFSGGRSKPDATLCAAIVAITEPVAIEVMRRYLGVPLGRLLQAVTVLERQGAVTVGADGVVAPEGVAWPTVERRVTEELQRRADVLRSRQEMVDWLLEGRTCRWSTVLGYLGQPGHPPCGKCDVCRAGDAPDTEATAPERLHHVEFGPGVVIQRRGDVMVVLFDRHGYRTLSSSVLEEEQLVAGTDRM